MLKVFIEIESSGEIRREHVSAYLYGKLSKRYHDEGLESYFNGSGVKGHTFRIPYRRAMNRGDIACIEVRGIDVIESKFSREIVVGERVRFGNVVGNVVGVSDVAYTKRELYDIHSPIVMRFGCRDRFDELGLTDSRLDVHEPCLVPSMDKELWETLVSDGLRRRAELIYGKDVIEEFGDVRVRAVGDRDVVVDLTMRGVGLKYLSMLGKVSVEGHDFWHEFVQRVGIGNRNTYGLGVVG